MRIHDSLLVAPDGLESADFSVTSPPREPPRDGIDVGIDEARGATNAEWGSKDGPERHRVPRAGLTDTIEAVLLSGPAPVPQRGF